MKRFITSLMLLCMGLTNMLDSENKEGGVI